MNNDELIGRLLALDVSCLCDADKGLRVIDSAIRPVQTGVKFAGRARTVRCHEDFLTVIQALIEAEPGEVLVIDTQDSHTAVAGELFTSEAAARGLAAIVIDGPCRDTAGLRALPVPVYARSTTPMAGTVNSLHETQIVINCGGVSIRPGDILFGDDDGIVVASAAELTALLPHAEAIQATEDAVLQQMHGGRSLLDLLNAGEHIARIQAGEKSQLTFLLE